MTESTSSTGNNRKSPHNPRAPLSHGLAYHIIAHILSLIVFALMITAWASSAVTSSKTRGGMLASTPWLVHLNQTASTHVKSISGVSGDSNSVKGWGLGVFKMCQWKFDKVDMMNNGNCVQGLAGWFAIGKDDIKGGALVNISELDLPESLGQILGILSVFLILPILITFIYSFILLPFAYKYRPSRSKATGKLIPVGTDIKTNKRRRLYDTIRGSRGWAMLSISLATVINVLIVIGVGINQVNNGDGKAEAEFGSGGWMLVVSSLIIPLIQALIYLGGLAVES